MRRSCAGSSTCGGSFQVCLRHHHKHRRRRRWRRRRRRRHRHHGHYQGLLVFLFVIFRRTVLLYRYYHIKISSTKLLIITHHYITISKSLFEAQHQILLIIRMLSQTTRRTGQYILYYPTISECDNIIEPLPVR